MHHSSYIEESYISPIPILLFIIYLFNRTLETILPPFRSIFAYRLTGVYTRIAPSLGFNSPVQGDVHFLSLSCGCGWSRSIRREMGPEELHKWLRGVLREDHLEVLLCAFGDGEHACPHGNLVGL
jgi:hypothetical protein